MERQRSFTFPLLLIAAGSLWLLINLGLMPAANLWALTHVWPYLLIALGLSLIIRSQWPEAAPLMSILIVAGLMAAVVYAPTLSWDGGEILDWDINISGSMPGSGEIESETRSPGEFHAIKLIYPAKLTIEMGDSPSVVIRADDNLLPQLSTEVRGGTLEIENSESYWSNRVNPSQTVEIIITVTELDRIEQISAADIQMDGLVTEDLVIVLGGAGNIELRDLEAESLTARLTGLGNIGIEGQAERAEIEITGSGDFDGADFATEDASVEINGLGSATVRVAEHLDAWINGAGSVNYYGSPSVTRDVNGLGTVSQAGE